MVVILRCYWDISDSGTAGTSTVLIAVFRAGFLSPSRHIEEFDLQLSHDHLLQILNSLLTILRFFYSMQICVNEASLNRVNK